MKYMGSKRYMLDNGLGRLIREQISHTARFVDPFVGAGSVVHFVAKNFGVPVLASDLQTYSTVLAGAIINRTKPLDSKKLCVSWVDKAHGYANKSGLFQKAARFEETMTKITIRDIPPFVKSARKLCEQQSAIGPVWNAYGGHYYGPSQALAFDYLLKNVPKKEPQRLVCLAALITAASKCAAAPGHTAQPFQPTRTAGKYLIGSWRIDPFTTCKKALETICPQYAKVKGKVMVGDVFDVIGQVRGGDLVIVDPPYSGVQYSRFYHVLETIARGKCGPVEGRGRYPNIEERPQSVFSNVSQSKKAVEDLLSALSKVKAKVIFTFPKGKCSNGLSGSMIKNISKKYFNIEEEFVHGRFSTLGGNNQEDNRKSRKNSQELLLLLKPR